MAIPPWVVLIILASLRKAKPGPGPGPSLQPQPVPQPPTPQPTPGTGLSPAPGIARPPGDPMGRACGQGEYNTAFWPTQDSIKARFEMMGYPTPPDRPTMNALGGDGRIGGGDDVYSAVVANFQTHYNAMSNAGNLGPMAGGLDVDGFVGPCTLNAIENIQTFYDYGDWQTALTALGVA